MDTLYATDDDDAPEVEPTFDCAGVWLMGVAVEVVEAEVLEEEEDVDDVVADKTAASEELEEGAFVLLP